MDLAGPEPMKALALAACCLSAVLSVARGDYTWPDSRAFGGPDIGVYRLDLYRQNGPRECKRCTTKAQCIGKLGQTHPSAHAMLRTSTACLPSCVFNPALLLLLRDEYMLMPVCCGKTSHVGIALYIIA